MLYKLSVLLAVLACANAAISQDQSTEILGDNMQCTSIGVGRHAMADGSTVTTHNNDCAQCDLRVTHVPARNWPKDSKRPVFPERSAYPKYAEEEEYNIHGPDYLVSNIDSSIYNWPAMPPFFYIDQVEHTYGYTLGSYGIQNERQLGMGESTCRAVFYSTPAYAGGKAHLNVRTIMEVAMERCETARCAIILMGDLAVQYGYYGAGEPTDTAANQENEAGEALTVSDPKETWMFHILPDDSGASAIWVAQRVPDDHITAVANQFVITSINLNDTHNFMGSANIYEQATRNKLWDPASGEAFNFAKVFTAARYGYGAMCTRRVWRVFTLAAPSLQLSPYTDTFGTFGFGPDGSQPYPFSVKPDKPLTVQDIYRMARDQYEGTQFDLTSHVDAGPFGDPTRWPANKNLSTGGMTPSELFTGLGFARGISLWRTVYSSVTQARADLPPEVGAVTWIAPYAPHYSSFMPIYANANNTPSAIAQGTQYKLDKSVNYWIHSLTSNYLSRWYLTTIKDTQNLQRSIEETIFEKQKKTEKEIASMLSSVESTLNSIAGGNSKLAPSAQQHALSVRDEAVRRLGDFHQKIAEDINKSWWDYFWVAIVTYRDVLHVIDFHAEDFTQAFKMISYPRWWLEQIGYWGAPGTPSVNRTSSVPIYPINVYSEPSPEAYRRVYPNGVERPYPTMVNPLNPAYHEASSQPVTVVSGSGFFPVSGAPRTYLSDILLLSVGAVGGAIVAYFAVTQSNRRRGYTVIQDGDDMPGLL